MLDDVDIKIMVSEDEEIFWLQLKSISGRKISAEQFIVELENYLNETSQAYRQRHPRRDSDH